MKQGEEYNRLTAGVGKIGRPSQWHNYTITDFFSNYEEINTQKLVNLGSSESKRANMGDRKARG